MSLPFPNKTIHQLFEQQVETTPEKIALIFEEQKLTYRELNARANRLAHYLKNQHDIRPDTLIGMCFERGAECIVSMLAILKAGGAYVPLDPGYPKERLAFMLQDTKAEIILTQEHLVARLPATEKSIVLVDGWRCNELPATDLHTPVEPQHLAYVLYTSGTTGRPKGVMVEHRNVVQLVKNQPRFDIGSQDVIAQCSTINFDAATFEIWAALLNGVALSVLSHKTVLSSQLLKTAIQQNNITICLVTSALFEQFASHDTTLFSGLNYLFVVGDVLKYSTVNKVLADNEHRPKAILNGYGPTETTTFATTCHIPEDFKTGQGAVPIGLPLYHTQIYILDDCLQPVPVGTVGELYIGGAGVARGYLNLPDATQQKFFANPFATPDEKKHGGNLRLYRSGDLARYLADGNIEFMGRRDQQVKIRGFRIECGEVAHAVLSNDRIAQAVVRAVEHCGEKQLVAYYVPKRSTFSDSPGESENQAEALTSCTAQSGMTRQELQKYLQARLPEYMIPQHFVPLDTLPLTPNGKLDVPALPALQSSAVLKSTPFIAPSNQVEVQLVALWSEVLGHKGIGIHDDFFELGGSSLLAMQLVNTINRELNVEVSVPDLFDLKNIEAMAKAIALSDSKNLPAKQRHREVRQDEATESETLILRDYFLSEFKLTYNESFVIELDQHVTFGEFHHAVDALMSECEILHANYICEEGRYTRRINKNSPFECDYSDLSHFVDSDVEFLDRINALVKKEFNISQDKLIRFYLFKLSDGRCKIFVAFFHALLDGTSIHILCKNLVQRMRLGVGNTDVKLPGSDTDDFYLLGSKIRERYGIGKDSEDEQRNKKIAYWHDFFNRFEYCSVSPTPDSSNSRLGKQEAFVIENDVKEILFALSKKLHISLFDVLSGCFMLLLNKFTQQNSIAVRTSVDERLYGPQYAQTLGCFVNNLFLGVEIDTDATLSDLLIASKRDKDQAIRNGLSYDTLVEHFREKIVDLSRIHFNLELRGSNELDSYASQIHTQSGQVKNDLYFELDVKKDKILARVEYKSASFDKNFIDSLIQCYANILENVDLFLNQPIKNINILPDTQYHKVVHSFNADKNYPSKKTIHQTFEEQVEKNPKQIALSCNGICVNQ